MTGLVALERRFVSSGFTRTERSIDHPMGSTAQYLEPATIDEAAELLAQGHVRVRAAGGSSQRPRPDDRILRLAGIPELHGLHRDEGGTLHLGAMLPLRVLARSRLIGTYFPALAESFEGLCPPALERGTLGGVLANADPLVPILPPLMTLHANLELVSAQGAREVPLGSWLAVPAAAGDRGELLSEVRIPTLQKNTYQHTAVFRIGNELSPPVLTFGASFLLEPAEVGDTPPTCRMAKIVLGGFADRLMWAAATERALTGQVLTPECVRSATEALIEACPDDHPHPWSYRHRVTLLRSVFERGLRSILRGEDRMVGIPVDASWPVRER